MDSVSRSRHGERTKKVRRSPSPKKKQSRTDKTSRRRTRSRSRSLVGKRDRNSKKHIEDKRRSPHAKFSTSRKHRSPSPVKSNKKKRTMTPPRSPSPPASPSPPRSPSPENSGSERSVVSHNSRNSIGSSSGDDRRPKSKSKRKLRSDRMKKSRRSSTYDDFPDFDHDVVNDTVYDDEKYPDIGDIYEAVVAAIKPFGFFCLLMGLRHKHYGLVHISEMKRDGYVTNVDEVVEMGQPVLVKVICNHPKIALSLKDVDQNTGEDLDVKRTQKLLQDPDFLDKEKNVRQNRGNGLVVSGLPFSMEDEYREMIADLLVNDMNLPAKPDHIGYCQPVQGIEFRKKGSTTQLVKIRFYEDESIPYNRDDVLSRYMTLRNATMWRYKEIVLNPEMRTFGPPRPRIKESLLNPGDFLPPPPGEDFSKEKSVINNEEEDMLERVNASSRQEDDDDRDVFVPIVLKKNEDDDEDELKLPKRPLASTSSSKAFAQQDVINQISNRVRANMKPATRFELPRTISSIPPQPTVCTAPASISSVTTTVLTSSPSNGPPGSSSKQPVFHSAPPPPVNLPTAFNANVPPPKLTINIAGVPQKASSASNQAPTLQQQISASAELKNPTQYPTLQQQLQQPPPQLPPFQTGAVPSHLAALQQQLQHTRFPSPQGIVRPPNVAQSSAAGVTVSGAQFPTYSIPSLISSSHVPQQPAQSPVRSSLGPYTNSAQAQQHLQQLLAMAASGQDPTNLFANRPDPVANIPALFGAGNSNGTQQQMLQQTQQQQQQQQQQSQVNPYTLQQPQVSRWENNPYAPDVNAILNSVTAKNSSNKEKSSARDSKDKSEKGGDSSPAPGEITQLLSLAKKLGFNIKTKATESS